MKSLSVSARYLRVLVLALVAVTRARFSCDQSRSTLPRGCHRCPAGADLRRPGARLGLTDLSGGMLSVLNEAMPHRLVPVLRAFLVEHAGAPDAGC